MEQRTFPTIQEFLTDLFGNAGSSWEKPKLGDPLTMMIDCLRLKIQKPTQRLPVVFLLGQKQQTGNSTFFDFMQDVFGSKAVKINIDHLGYFNATYADKSVICVDDITLTFNDVDAKYNLQALANTDKISYRVKGKAPRKIPFYGWLMMSSSNEETFRKITNATNLFLVTKQKDLSKIDSNLRAKMVEELPAFVYYLWNTDIEHSQESSRWFNPKYIEHDPLIHVINPTRSPYLDKIIKYAVVNFFLTFLVNEKQFKENNIQISFKCDLKNLISIIQTYCRFKIDTTDIKKWLADNANLKKGKVTAFKIPDGYDINGKIVYKHGKGKVIEVNYFDWVTEEDLSEPMKEIHAKLKKEEVANVQ